MENETSILTDPPLTLFLEYDYLPLDQLGSLLFFLEGIYESVFPFSRIGIVGPWEDYFEHRQQLNRGPGRFLMRPPMCVVSSNTEHSLTLKFDNGKNAFPQVRFAKGDLEILLPRWTAALVLVGAAITYGVGQYERFLAVQKSNLEIEKLRIEIEQLKTKSLERDPELEFYIERFRREAVAPNITNMEVNGIPIIPNDERRSDKH